MAETVASSASADKQEPREEERQSVVIVFFR